ncbi:MAG TPA: hypothetical protein VMW24_25010 [Sedimentisphaerales bacterium]|nr:hypothetical protein [Sedimentisphaerales bacterium]
MTRLMLFGDALVDIDDVRCAVGIGIERVATQIYMKTSGTSEKPDLTLVALGDAKGEFDAWAKSLNRPFILNESKEEE